MGGDTGFCDGEIICCWGAARAGACTLFVVMLGVKSTAILYFIDDRDISKFGRGFGFDRVGPKIDSYHPTSHNQGIGSIAHSFAEPSESYQFRK